MRFLARVWTFGKSLWYGETAGLATGAFIVGVASIAADLAGVLRDRLLAGSFGASSQLDAYYAAFRIPDTLYTLFVIGALSAGFIPLFAEYAEKRGHHEAMKLVSQVFSLIGLVMAIISVVGIISAPWFVPLTVPGFSPETRTLTVQLSRLMFLSPLFLGLSAVMGGVLQSTKRFFSFSLAPVLYNVGIIVGILCFAPIWGIRGVVMGVVLGALLHFLAQLSVVWKLGMPRLPWPSLKPEGVRRLLPLMLPRIAGLAVTQTNLIIILIFASSVGVGSVAVFNLANNLQSFALGLIGISFAIAAFPVLSQAMGASKPDHFVATFRATIRKILFFILPITALLILLRVQIVRTILGDGRFNWNDTIRTYTVLGWLALSLPAQCIVPLGARAFYAMQNSKTPLYIGLAAEAMNLLLAWSLRGTFGITGLAIAFSVSSLINAVLLLVQLNKKYSIFHDKGSIARFFGQAILSTIALCIATYLVRQLVGTIFAPLHSFFEVLLQAVIAGCVGILVFLVAMRLLKSREMHDLETACLASLKKWRDA